MRSLRRSALRALVAAATLAASPALAQSPEDELLGKDPPINDNPAGLEEAKPIEKIDTSDPDGKALEQVNTRRREFEKRINDLANAEPRFTKLDGQLEKLTSEFIKRQDEFLQKQSEQVEKFTQAKAIADDKAQKKAADEVAKLRKGLLGEIDKLAKRVDKLDVEREKLLKQWRKEQGEEAPPAPVSEEAPPPEEGAGSDD